MNEVLGVILGLLLVMVCILPVFTGQTLDLSALNTFLESVASSTSSTQNNNYYSSSSGYSGSQSEYSSNSYNSYNNSNTENESKSNQAYITFWETKLEDAKRDLEWAEEHYRKNTSVSAYMLLQESQKNVRSLEEKLRKARGY
jgi:uncharacterized protein YxeA